MQPQSITVRYFAVCRDAAGKEREEIELPSPVSVSDFLEDLFSRYPSMRAGEKQLRVAVNREYAPAEGKIRPGDEVALIPPVSGGSGRSDAPEIVLTAEPIRLEELTAPLPSGGQGAMATFCGIVRPDERGEPIESLEYEIYPEMADIQMKKVIGEIRERWPVFDLRIAHRYGEIPVGQTAVAIVVTSGHRKEAFEACRYAIDRIKEIVPIWKIRTRAAPFTLPPR